MRTLRLLTLHCNKGNNNDINNSKPSKTFLTVDNGRFHVLGLE
jgi:hypothetical protein